MQIFAVKLLANSLVAIDFYIALTMFDTLSHFTSPIPLEILYFNWSSLKAINVLTNHTKLCYVYGQFKRTNLSCSPSKISQSINVKWRTCDRNGKHCFKWKQEKLWSFDKAKNVLIKKNKHMSSEKSVSTRFG